MILEFDGVFGLNLSGIGKEIPQKIISLAEQREKLRSEKKYNESDKVREKIEKQGYIVLDEIDGYRIIKGSNNN